jgi:hypothetical protein
MRLAIGKRTTRRAPVKMTKGKKKKHPWSQNFKCRSDELIADVRKTGEGNVWRWRLTWSMCTIRITFFFAIYQAEKIKIPLTTVSLLTPTMSSQYCVSGNTAVQSFPLSFSWLTLRTTNTSVDTNKSNQTKKRLLPHLFLSFILNFFAWFDLTWFDLNWLGFLISWKWGTTVIRC